MRLHIFTKRANEILSFDLQVPLAKSLGFKKGSGLLAVENFMQTILYMQKMWVS